VVDARRALLYSSTRRLDTESELMQVRTQLNEARRLLEKLDDERRLEIQQELQAAQLKLAEERSRLEGLRAKLEAAGIAVPRPSGEEPMPEITIIRRGEERSLTLKAGYEDEIQPGDVVQVTLRYAQVSAGTELDRPDPSRYAARGAR
jgi:polysaccharide export outer membrane protein